MPTTVKIRSFSPSDLTSIVALWNRCLPKDPMTVERFWQLFLLDANFDQQGALVAEAAGEPAGFLQAIVRRYPMGINGLESDKGWITAFFVAPELRRQGIGTALFDEGMAFLHQKGRTEACCNGYSPYYIFPGVDSEYTEALDFLASRGCTVLAEAVAMGMKLDGAIMPDRVKERRDELHQEGYEVRMFQIEDTLPILEFADNCFPYWASSVLDGLQHGNLEITIATCRGKIVGLAQWENTFNDPPHGARGRFGPFGVHPDLRSKGLGSVIFYSLVERVALKGCRYLWFGWAGGRNLSFYQRAGCVITRQFQLFKKHL